MITKEETALTTASESAAKLNDNTENKVPETPQRRKQKLLTLTAYDADALRSIGYAAECFALKYGCVANLTPGVRFIIFDDLSQAAQRLADDVAKLLPSAAVWRTYPEILGLQYFVSDLGGIVSVELCFDADAPISRKCVNDLLQFAFPIWNGGRR